LFADEMYLTIERAEDHLGIGIGLM